MKMKLVSRYLLWLLILACFGITAAAAQSAKERAAGFDPAESRPRIVKQSKSRDAGKATKRNKFMDQVEENLPRIFDRAKEGGAVLIYEEADDLFNSGSDDDDESGDDNE